MSINWLRPLIAASEQPAVGTFVQTPHAGVAESLAGLPFDFLCAEGEHSPFGGEMLRHFATACELHGVPLLARIPEPTSVYCAEALDAGACGILAPRVNTLETATAVAEACRYPPVGSRGVGPGRASDYGAGMDEYIKDARANTLVAVQIETAEGFANLDDILSVDGIDLVFVGPADLAVSLTGSTDSEAAEVRDAITSILRRARDAGRMTGIFAGTAEAAAGYAQTDSQWRVDLIMLASDLVFMGKGAADMLRDYWDGLS